DLAFQLAAIASKTPATGGNTAPAEFGLPWTAQTYAESIVKSPICAPPAAERAFRHRGTRRGACGDTRRKRTRNTPGAGRSCRTGDRRGHRDPPVPAGWATRHGHAAPRV